MTGAEIRRAEELQRRLYDEIAGRYERHFSDEFSEAYRQRFICEPLLAGIDWRGRRVLDAMCGTGLVTGHLLPLDARVTGLDVSPEMIARCRARWPACEAMAGSILDSGLPDGAFDAVVVVSGLHHLHPHVTRAFDEIFRLLKPGGYFCVSEPHAGSMPDVIRRLWYRVDPLFEENEAAIDLEALRRANASRFELVKTGYGGNLAYVFVLHSLVLRIPLWLKRWYSPPLLRLEAAVSRWQGLRTSCFAVCQWRKVGTPDTSAAWPS